MKNKIISVVCALAMMMTMMGSLFITASAETAAQPVITFDVKKHAETVGDYAEVTVGYSGLAEGSVIKGIDVVIPMDTTTFQLGDADDGIVYSNRQKAIVCTWLATAEKDYIKATSGTIGTFKLILQEGAELGSTVDLEVKSDSSLFSLETVGDVNMSGKLSLQAGKRQKPAKPAEPVIPDEPYVVAKVVEQPVDENGTVTVEFWYGNLPEGSIIKGMDVVIPVDNTKVTVQSADDGIVYSNRQKAIVCTWLATAEKDYITAASGKIGTAVLKIEDAAKWAEEIVLEADKTKSIFSLETGDVNMAGAASKIVVGSGDDKPTEPTAPVINGVTISPASASMKPGETKTFTATVSGTNGYDKDLNEIKYDDTVTWKMSGAKSKSTTFVDGTLTLAADEDADAITVEATANGDKSKSATATVTVQKETQLDQTPTTSTIGGTKYFGVKFGAGEKFDEFKEKVTAGTITEVFIVGVGKDSKDTLVGNGAIKMSAADFQAAVEANEEVAMMTFAGAGTVGYSVFDQAGNVIR